MSVVVLNELAYSSSETNPLKALDDCISFSADDWGTTRAMAWVWGIVCGWDDESLESLADRHGWSLDAVARLRSLHVEFQRMLREGEA